MAKSHKAAVRLKKGAQPIDNGLRFQTADEAAGAASSFADLFGDADASADDVQECMDEINAQYPPAAKTSKAR